MRVKELLDELQELEAMRENYTATQARCTALLDALRYLWLHPRADVMDLQCVRHVMDGGAWVRPE